jgi:quercetin dioxygenase-like cupin family protein
MNELDFARRSILLSLGVLGVGPILTSRISRAADATPGGYVLDASRGEHLIHFRDGGDIFIMAGTARGSDNFSMGTQQIKAGGSIPIHRHLHMEEAFYVIDGSGVCTLEDVQHPVSRGSSIFIPRNTWHGFSTPDHELVLLWTMTPGGLDNFFRETCSPPGAPPKTLSHEQIRQVALKYGIEFR